MGDDWFIEAGATGELLIERRTDGWYVGSNPAVGDTRCLLDDDVSIDNAKDIQRVNVSIKNFRRSMGNDPHFLTLSKTDGLNSGNGSLQTGQSENTKEIEREKKSRSQREGSENELWELKDFRGSGEYVDVEATIDTVFWINKDEPCTPDLKGQLTDSSLVVDSVYFIVTAGVIHPYFEEGERFLFKNVKDHLYKPKQEVQVLISENTSIETLDE